MRYLPAGIVGLAGAVLVLALLGSRAIVGADAAPIGHQAVPRDAFPVFDDPPMVTAQEAEARGLVYERDAVIGVAHGGEARAYPVTMMGVHELGNDTIAGVPIAVSW